MAEKAQETQDAELLALAALVMHDAARMILTFAETVQRAKSPPVVCTGSGTIAVEWQGRTSCSSLTPSDGTCGICKQRIQMDGWFKVVTHAYAPEALVQRERER